MRQVKDVSERASTLPGTPPPADVLARSTPKKHVAASFELLRLAGGELETVKQSSLNGVAEHVAFNAMGDAASRQETVSLCASPFMNAQDFEEFRQLGLHGGTRSAELGPFNVFRKSYVVEGNGENVDDSGDISYYAASQPRKSSQMMSEQASRLMGNTVNEQRTVPAFPEEAVRFHCESEENPENSTFLTPSVAYVGPITYERECGDVAGSSLVGAATHSQSGVLSTVASLAEKLNGGNSSHGADGSSGTSVSGHADFPGSPASSLRPSNHYNASLSTPLQNALLYSPSPPQSFYDESPDALNLLLPSSLSVRATPFLTGVNPSSLFPSSVQPWDTIRSAHLDDMGDSFKLERHLQRRSSMQLSSPVCSRFQPNAVLSASLHSKPLLSPQTSAIDSQLNSIPSLMSWYSSQKHVERQNEDAARSSSSPSPPTPTATVSKLDVPGSTTMETVDTGTAEAAAAEALKAFYTAVPQDSSSAPPSFLLPPLVQQPVDPPSIIAPHVGAGGNASEKLPATTVAPSSNAQVAASALMREEPTDLCQTLDSAKTLLKTSLAALTSARSTIRGSQHMGDTQLEALLAASVDAVAAAVNVLAPGYLDMIAEERCNSNKRPMMLAHPDEFKNPSSFLKIYGDPQCNVPPQHALRLHPRKSKDGNWECVVCKNINYPRRFRCNNPRCKALRGQEGDKLVGDYARQVFHLYLTKYKHPLNTAINATHLPLTGAVISSTPSCSKPQAASWNGGRLGCYSGHDNLRHGFVSSVHVGTKPQKLVDSPALTCHDNDVKFSVSSDCDGPCAPNPLGTSQKELGSTYYKRGKNASMSSRELREPSEPGVCADDPVVRSTTHKKNGLDLQVLEPQHRRMSSTDHRSQNQRMLPPNVTSSASVLECNRWSVDDAQLAPQHVHRGNVFQRSAADNNWGQETSHCALSSTQLQSRTSDATALGSDLHHQTQTPGYSMQQKLSSSYAQQQQQPVPYYYYYYYQQQQHQQHSHGEQQETAAVKPLKSLFDGAQFSASLLQEPPPLWNSSVVADNGPESHDTPLNERRALHYA